MEAYITTTGMYLPGSPRSNEEISNYMGTLEHEHDVRRKVLRANGIKYRHYALDTNQECTSDVYSMGARAALDCLRGSEEERVIPTFLGAGTTLAPETGPGIASRIHEKLSTLYDGLGGLEICSNSGICSASAQSLLNAIRAVKSGEHEAALSIGSEHASKILRSTFIRPPNDYCPGKALNKTRWFMSVFLRSMLSDGAGAFLVEGKPRHSGVSLKIDWMHSESFAHETERCMWLEAETLSLYQNVEVLAKYMKPCVEKFVQNGLARNAEKMGNFKWVLPHLSSFYFKRHLLGVLDGEDTQYWTNLETAGNTGAASIYIMLHAFLQEHSDTLCTGERILLFIPESGHFNFVMIAATVIKL
ncbi:MAG: hypothetical protein ACPGN3_18055 [Opitutales bacterium]